MVVLAGTVFPVAAERKDSGNPQVMRMRETKA
jgi:hypothetical protein